MRKREGRALTEGSIHGRPVAGHRPLEPEVAGPNPAHEIQLLPQLARPFSIFSVQGDLP